MTRFPLLGIALLLAAGCAAPETGPVPAPAAAEPASPAPQTPPETPDGIAALAFSSDGLRLLVGDAGGALRCRDLWADREAWRATAHSGQVRTISADPAGRVVVTLGEDLVVAARDLATGEARWSVRIPDGALYPRQPVAFARDGRSLAWGGLDNSIRVLNSEDGAEIASLPTVGATALAFSADGRTLYAGSHMTEITAFDLDTRKVTATLLETGPRGAGYVVTDLALSPDGSALWAGYEDGSVREWTLSAGGSRGFASVPLDVSAPVVAVGFPGEGEYPAAVYVDGRISRFTYGGTLNGDRMIGSDQSRVDVPLVEAAAFDPTSRRIAVGGRDGVVRVLPDPFPAAR